MPPRNNITCLRRAFPRISQTQNHKLKITNPQPVPRTLNAATHKLLRVKAQKIARVRARAHVPKVFVFYLRITCCPPLPLLQLWATPVCPCVCAALAWQLKSVRHASRIKNHHHASRITHHTQQAPAAARLTSIPESVTCDRAWCAPDATVTRVTHNYTSATVTHTHHTHHITHLQTPSYT
jgi:hypothetical protein